MRSPANARAAGVSRRSIRTPSPAARRCRAKFLLYFPDGFVDETYVESERAYKCEAHRRWQAEFLLPFAADGLVGRAGSLRGKVNLIRHFNSQPIGRSVRLSPMGGLVLLSPGPCGRRPLASRSCPGLNADVVTLPGVI